MTAAQPAEEYLRRSQIQSVIGMFNLTVGEVELMLNISLPPVTDTAISPTVTVHETCYCGGFVSLVNFQP